jgi:hypothetical protein
LIVTCTVLNDFGLEQEDQILCDIRREISRLLHLKYVIIEYLTKYSETGRYSQGGASNQPQRPVACSSVGV